ncbi:hypothetical protein E0H22_04325 [Rhodopseudomonas boonkerdii]|uniref:hypothetical protein n=1 Tax=Rhodopseudomonas boonkerdii TaxID=475937 RepID=UPI001E3B4EDB|nr:hypothetical protein [Rhodopseudomonas boonkerdii]UGV24969.1 hypothetical protein E0H22_04325 [Rhodopseudomonas boonkerdii]
MTDLVLSDALKLYFVRLRHTHAAVGIFYGSWGSLRDMLPSEIDARLCEAVELNCLGGIVFFGAPVLHVQSGLHPGSAPAYAEQSCVLTGMFPQILADDGTGECADYAVFEPLLHVPDFPALAAAMSDSALLEDWNEIVMFPGGRPDAWKVVVREQLQRRGIPHDAEAT